MKRRIVGVDVQVNDFKRPRSKLHGACLFVERKMCDVDWARAPKRSRAVPWARAVGIDDHASLVLFKSTAEFAIGTVGISELSENSSSHSDRWSGS